VHPISRVCSTRHMLLAGVASPRYQQPMSTIVETFMTPIIATFPLWQRPSGDCRTRTRTE
jgi:hypothetical protein